MPRAHATTVAAELAPASAPEPSTARVRAKSLRREHLPGYALALAKSSYVTLVHTRIHASVRQLAKLLHVAPSRAHLLTDDTAPQSITVADVLFLASHGNEEGAAIARGIWRDVGTLMTAAAKARRGELAGGDVEQLELFGSDNRTNEE